MNIDPPWKKWGGALPIGEVSQQQNRSRHLRPLPSRTTSINNKIQIQTEEYAMCEDLYLRLNMYLFVFVIVPQMYADSNNLQSKYVQ